MGNTCFIFWCVEPEEIVREDLKNNMELNINEKKNVDETDTDHYGYYFNTSENCDCIEF
tara:strand:- start:418 stop:594 length:177 start_codon:yes stop_codon:yes gene_type:complete